MILTNVRVDWLFIWDRNKDGKYSCCAIIKKDDKQHAEVEAAIAKAKAAGIAKGLFTEANMSSSAFKHCLRDGDIEIETEDRPKHYAGASFFNASNVKKQPGVVGPDGKPLMEPSRLYSGCYVNLDVNFFPYNHPKGGKGIGAGFNNIMLVKEGDRLDGQKSADEAFAGFAGFAAPEDDLQ